MEEILTPAELEKQEEYFSFYKHAPWIIAAILFGLFFIWGIVDPCVFKEYHYYRYYYGVLKLANGFLCWLIWVGIGIVASIITKVTLCISFSHKLLQIYYLQQLLCYKNFRAN